MKRTAIAVIDGQGGGIGATIIKEFKRCFGEQYEIIALGTNSIATSAMLSAGANKGATGENAIVHTLAKVQYILGPINIILPNSMLGELTEKMSLAISNSDAKKIILPITQENVYLVGVSKSPLPHLVKDMIELFKQLEVDKDV